MHKARTAQTLPGFEKKFSSSRQFRGMVMLGRDHESVIRFFMSGMLHLVYSFQQYFAGSASTARHTHPTLSLARARPIRKGPTIRRGLSHPTPHLLNTRSTPDPKNDNQFFKEYEDSGLFLHSKLLPQLLSMRRHTLRPLRPSNPGRLTGFL